MRSTLRSKSAPAWHLWLAKKRCRFVLGLMVIRRKVVSTSNRDHARHADDVCKIKNRSIHPIFFAGWIGAEWTMSRDVSRQGIPSVRVGASNRAKIVRTQTATKSDASKSHKKHACGMFAESRVVNRKQRIKHNADLLRWV